MTFFEKIKQPGFWVNVLKIAIPFLFIVTLFSLVFNSGKDIFSGDFATVNEINFSNKKWIRFWLSKIVISLIYGIYISNKNTK